MNQTIPTLKIIELPVGKAFIPRCAARIVSDLNDYAHTDPALPCFRNPMLLVPNLALAPALSSALRPHFSIPPQVTTLYEFARQANHDPVQAHSARQFTLYQQLKKRDWFTESTLWQICLELTTLFDDLSKQAAALPDSQETFLDLLERAYALRHSSVLSFEGRLIYMLWQAEAAGTPSVAAAIRLGLAQQAASASHTLYALCEAPPGKADLEFFSAYAKNRPVTLFVATRASLHPSPEGCEGLLTLAWPAKVQPISLIERAKITRNHYPESPLISRFSLVAAMSLEHEAHFIAQQVQDWLATGKQSIALIAADRLTARRVRALLERADILVRDETGWKLATTRAASIMDTVIEAIITENMQSLSPVSLSEWLNRLRIWLDTSRISASDADANEALTWLENDAAGQVLLDLLQCRHDELVHLNIPISLAEWRDWLDQELELATFTDKRIISPVVITHLAATRLRCFDAAVIMGADTEHMASARTHTILDNPLVRSELGLPPPEDAHAILCNDLAALVANTDEVVATWQRFQGKDPQLLCPELALLSLLHRCAYGDDLIRVHANAMPDFLREHSAGTPPPQPTVAPSDLPQRMSASAYATLLACPYQYYSQSVLGLAETEVMPEQMEKRDYGELLHRILHDFHQQFPVLLEHDNVILIEALTHISETVFSLAIARNFLDQAWLIRWNASIPGYIAWQRERETTGWRVLETETQKEFRLSLPNGDALILHGRLDRVDGMPNGCEAVVDYKAQSHEKVRQRLVNPREDVQLAFYTLLQGESVTQASYAALDEPIPIEATLPAPQTWARQQAQRLTQIFIDLQNGAALPANGADSVCRWCKIRGLCRKDYYTQP